MKQCTYAILCNLISSRRTYVYNLCQHSFYTRKSNTTRNMTFATIANYVSKTYKPPILAAFGNPLLDIEAIVVDRSIIKKYNLDTIYQKEVAAEEFDTLFKEANAKCNIVRRSPGGSAQNTLRLFQWLVQSPGCTVIFGGIGTDDNGKFLENAVTGHGVRTSYAYHQDKKTGTCLSFIHGNRCLIAHIGAANFFTPSDLDTPENWEILDNVLMIYVEGFFITHDFTTAARLINFSNTKGICFAMNLNAPYVSENYGDKLIHLMQNANIIFGRTSEYLALSKYLSNPVETAADVAFLIQRESKVSDKIYIKEGLPPLLQEGPVIVITDGRKPVSVLKGLSNKILEFPVPQLDRDCIKDTTGAGDAFVAGFLAAAFGNMSLETCVQKGHWIAQKIIQQIGVELPSDSPGNHCNSVNGLVDTVV